VGVSSDTGVCLGVGARALPAPDWSGPARPSAWSGEEEESGASEERPAPRLSKSDASDGGPSGPVDLVGTWMSDAQVCAGIDGFVREGGPRAWATMADALSKSRDVGDG